MAPHVNRRLGLMFIIVSAIITITTVGMVVFGSWLNALLVYVAAVLAVGVALARLTDERPAPKAPTTWHAVAPPARTLYARFSAMFRFHIT